MICHHCPEKKFENEVHLQAYIAEHTRIQQSLRRRGGRTYGSKLAQKQPTSVAGIEHAHPESILPAYGASAASAPPPMHHHSSETRSEDVNEPSNLLADIMSQDNTYLLFRRFSAMNTRNLLRMQSELMQLEKRLSALARANEQQVTTETDTGPLPDLVEAKLFAYNEALLQYSHLSNLPNPCAASLSDLRHWVSHTRWRDSPALAFLGNSGHGHGDLIALAQASAEKSWAYRLVEGFTWRWLSREAYGGRTMALPQYGRLHIYEDNMVQIAHRVLLTVVSSILLLVPMGVLSSIKDKEMAVIIVALCCLLMAMVMAIATGCRDHEIIMATSAYAAALIVYTTN